MTAQPESMSPADIDCETLRQLLLLVLRGEVDDHVDWAALYDRAVAERVAALAWHRAGDLIRAHAPAHVVAAWRAVAMQVALQVEVLLGTIGEVLQELHNAGVEVAVLKGAPLSQLLYGDAAVRPLADCDVYVPLAHRSAAAEVLARSGWTSRTGEPPSEESFERWAGGQRNVIEVHSSAIDDGLLSHLVIPVKSRLVPVGIAVFPALVGDELPAFLAAHLAKHETAPLLWVIDLYTLWARLDESDRARARECARRMGLRRHLEWALRLAACAESGAAGDPVALSRLRQLQRATGDWGRVRRLVALSATPWDAARVLAGRVWPAEWRDGWARMPHYLLQRGARWIARRLQLAGARRAGSATRALSVDETELSSMLEETLARGLAIWIRARGTSMQPAIPPSAAAHIVPVERRAIREHDIVLARLPHGAFVLHRVERIRDDTVQLKGDAMRRRDDLVPRTAIVGVCDQVEINGTVYRAEDRPRDAVALLRDAARTRLRRLVTQRGT